MEQNPQSFEFTIPGEPENAMASLAFAWRRKGLVVLVLIVGLGLGYLNFLQKTPIFGSTAQLLIVDAQPKLLSEGLEIRDSSADIHLALIQSQAVIDSAISIGRLDELDTLRGSSNPAARVMAGLSVELVVGNQRNNGTILKLAYESRNPDDCPEVLHAIVTAYEQFLKEMYDDVSQETIALIAEAKDQLEKEISESEAALRQVLAESPLLVRGETAENVHETRLMKIEVIRSEAVLENSKLRAKIDALQAAAANGLSRATLNLVVGHIETNIYEDSGEELEDQKNDKRKALNDRLFPLLLEEQILLENHGPEHPSVVTVRKRIEWTREYHERMTVAESQQVKSEKDPQRPYFEVYMDSLKEQIKINDQTIKEMSTLFEKERKDAQGMSVHMIKEDTYRSEIARKTRFFDVVLKRLEEISLVRDRGGAEVRVIHPPRTGGQTAPDLFMIMGISVALGLLGGLGLAYVVDFADRRFRSPDEIRNDLGVPVIGHIPVIPKTGLKKQAADDDNFPTEIRTLHAPGGRIAEAYRAVRTAIYFSTRGGGHQVIQITSPTPGDGKSTLAANLAISIANSGKRVLLVDADFRRPRIHTLLRVPNDVGTADVIEDSVELLDAVQSPKVDNLSVLTCGKRRKNPSELLTSRRFEEMLETLREEFELVIIDTPPVMAVTDPLNVAPRVDGVLLVLRLSKNARSAARQTLDALEEVGATVLGVVVNGVGGEESYGTNGYHKYGYGYSKDYSYGGRNGYGSGGYDDDQTYYADETEAELSSHEGNGRH